MSRKELIRIMIDEVGGDVACALWGMKAYKKATCNKFLVERSL